MSLFLPRSRTLGNREIAWISPSTVHRSAGPVSHSLCQSGSRAGLGWAGEGLAVSPVGGATQGERFCAGALLAASRLSPVRAVAFSGLQVSLSARSLGSARVGATLLPTVASCQDSSFADWCPCLGMACNPDQWWIVSLSVSLWFGPGFSGTPLSGSPPHSKCTAGRLPWLSTPWTA